MILYEQSETVTESKDYDIESTNDAGTDDASTDKEYKMYP